MQETVILVRDENGSGKVYNTLELKFDQIRISARDIITERIFQEVQLYNAKAADYRHTLVQPSEHEQRLNGSAIKTVNAEKQLQVAFKAFESNGFFLLVNDKQIEDLDEEVVVTAESTISFIKLTPLVGG